MGNAQWHLPDDARSLTIDEFVEIVLDDSVVFDERRKSFEEKIRHHTIPQTHPFNCLHFADFVGRYEKLQDDFTTVARRVGLSNSALPRLNYTNPCPWESVLVGSTLQRCVNYYRRDFEELGYHMPIHAEQVKQSEDDRLLARARDLIGHLRNRRDIESNWLAFRNLVEGELERVLSTFSSRWLVSICDTYADHAKSEVRRRNALAISLLINMIRLADTLYEDRDVRSERVDAIRQRQLDLYDGLQTLHLDRQDTCLNLAKRLSRSLKEDHVLHEIYLELIRRAKRSDNLLTRFQRRSARPEWVFPEDPSEIRDNYGVK